jgi:hypothetical protein
MRCTLPATARCSKDALGPRIRSLLSNGISVVLDFPGNTRSQRAWLRHLFEALEPTMSSISSMLRTTCASVSYGRLAELAPGRADRSPHAATQDHGLLWSCGDGACSNYGTRLSSRNTDLGLAPEATRMAPAPRAI